MNQSSRQARTRLVWNSVTSTFSAPSKRSDAVSDEMTCAISLRSVQQPQSPTPTCERSRAPP